jgi:hypothetical protein
VKLHIKKQVEDGVWHLAINGERAGTYPTDEAFKAASPSNCHRLDRNSRSGSQSKGLSHSETAGPGDQLSIRHNWEAFAEQRGELK